MGLNGKARAGQAPPDTPLRVSPLTKRKVRLGSALLGCTQGEFVAVAVEDFFRQHGEVLDETYSGTKDDAETASVEELLVRAGSS
jgi:hypothetical protein